VISSDLSESRLRHVRQRLSPRHGGGCEILVADASATTPFRIEFDAVLLDAPCSGLGTLRRNPEIKWRIRPRRLMEFSAIQGRMLDALSGSVCVGGRLLYSTCSTEPEENEQAVERFLGRHPGFRLIRPEDPPGVERWLDASGLFRTFPGGRIWDGFFAALMVRIS
jgi:16S rRNA (cytosine967-C5)-methyltransferase